MRSKGALDTEISKSDEWKLDGQDIGMRSIEVVNEGGQRKYLVHSVSGNEQNKLFLNRNGTAFTDVSLFSGADSKADSRVVAYSDLNLDGFQDLVVINANNPHIEVYENQFAAQGRGNFIAVRLEGGNHEGNTNSEWSNRDGYGAVVSAVVDGTEMTKELRCGEGFAAQNSKTMFFGLGDSTKVDEITVTWPSGKKQSEAGVTAGQLITFDERGNVEKGQWNRDIKFPTSKTRGAFAFDSLISDKDHQLRVFTTLETACPNCNAAVLELNQLAEKLDQQPVAFYALLTDKNDKPADLEEFARVRKPSYNILQKMNEADRAAIKRFISSSMGAGVSPCYLITDTEGNLKYLETDMPTYSDVKRLLHELSQ